MASHGVMWFDILKAKYFPSCSPLFGSASGGSQFWRQLVKVRNYFRSRVNFGRVFVHCWSVCFLGCDFLLDGF